MIKTVLEMTDQERHTYIKRKAINRVMKKFMESKVYNNVGTIQ